MATETTTIIERELRVAAPPETVFSYWVEPARLTTWMGREATIEARPGGRFEIDYNTDNHMRGTVLECDPPRRLVYTFGWLGAEPPSPGPGASTVEIDFEPDGDGTLMRLRHSGLDPAEVPTHAEGWDQHLAALPRVATA